MNAVEPLCAMTSLKTRFQACAAEKAEGTLVLLHGWGADSRCWRAVSAHLLLHYNLLYLDLPGFGINRDVGIDELPELEDAILELLPEDVTLVGWSLGGMLAARVAAKTGKVKSVITLASNAVFVATPDWPNAMAEPTFQQFAEGFSQSSSATLNRFFNLQALGDENRRQVAGQVREWCMQPLEKPWLNGLHWLAQMDNRRELSSLACRALHVLGEQDALVPVAVAEQLRSLNMSHKVVTLPHTGHASLLSRPETVARLICNFLQESHSPFAKNDVAKSFSQAASDYDTHARLQRLVVSRLVEKTRQVSLPEGPVIDLGCGTGVGLRLLRSRFGRECIGLDFAEGMVRAAMDKVQGQNISLLQADIEKLPLADQTLALAFSSLTLQWSSDLCRDLREVYRVLQPGGCLSFSTLGPRTLFELRKSWLEVDSEQHVNHFLPSSSVVDAILSCGFSVFDFTEDCIVQSYESALHVMRELKGIGAHNVNHQRPKGLTGRNRLGRLCDYYQATFGDAKGVPATYQVHYYLLKKPRL